MVAPNVAPPQVDFLSFFLKSYMYFNLNAKSIKYASAMNRFLFYFCDFLFLFPIPEINQLIYQSTNYVFILYNLNTKNKIE